MNKKILLVYFATLFGILVFIGLIFLAPYFNNRSSILGNIIYLVFSPLCHQNASRCFYFLGYPLAVCARCLGIYIGFMLGTFLYPAVRGFSSIYLPQTKLFLCLSAPVVLDTLGNFLLIWSTPGWIRFVFGLTWGWILPFYFITGVVDFLDSRNRR